MRRAGFRLTAGDYSGQPDDSETRHPALHLELTLDYSAAASGEASTIYTANVEPHLLLPQLCRSLAPVERPPGLLRFDRYLSFRMRGTWMHRLRLALEPA